MSVSRIVCTIGPATCTAEMLWQLAEAGMNMARLNGSHADLDWHAKTIALLRQTLPEMPVLLDIPGRKIRTTALSYEPSFGVGDIVVLTTDVSHDGSQKVPVNYADLHNELDVGDVVFADDGTLRFTVDRVEGRDIACRAETAGMLKSRKGINVPYVRLNTQLITDRDHEMIGFAREHEVDFVGISFVESSQHIEAIRDLCGGSWPRVLAKVENQGGLDHLDEIVAVADAVMIDRGDLSVETNLETLALMQKRILAAAREHGKPAIVATEMLHTMIENPFPTKAEVSDITNAVLDGCAAVMLSGETAIGAHPVAAARVMRQIATAAEAHQQTLLDAGEPAIRRRDGARVPQAMEDAIALICRSLPISKIVAVTISGYAARMIATRRPRQPILAVSNDRMAARSFNLLPGTEGVFVDIPFSKTSTDHIAHCLEALWRQGKLINSDLVLVTSVGYPRSGNRMNLLQTHTIADLVETLGWTR